MTHRTGRPAAGFAAIGALLVLLPGIGLAAPAQEPPIDRTVLPIPEPPPPTITEFDVRKAKAPPRFEVKPPAGARTS